MASRSPYSSRLWEPLDQWMESQGYYRKHTARDGSCLFRAVAEQVFHTQVLHSQVRMACVRFMERHKELFNECLEGSLEEHISSMQNPWEWGGELEMSVVSFMYRRDFLIFREVGMPPFEATVNGFKDKILLCYLQNSQYDSVYPKEHIKGAAFCQSIVYHILYERVFKLEETDYAVNKMLHDKSVRLRRDSCVAQLNAYTSARKQLINNVNGKYDVKIEDIPTENKVSEEWYNNAREILYQGIIPFPYKVAKALDPDIYRNIEFDVWNELRKELRWGINNSMYPGESGELRVGSKCLVRLESLPGKEMHAHIQEMALGKGPVLVYIEELAQKCTVQFDCLEPIPKALKNSHVEHEGERRPGLWESSQTSLRPTPASLQSSSGDIPAFSKNQRGHPWNTSTKNPKYNTQASKDLANGVGGRNEVKTTGSSCKEGGGRKVAGNRGRVRAVSQTSSLSSTPQVAPRVNCQPSNLNQDQRYMQLFSNQQLPLHLQTQPPVAPVNLPRQVTSFLESNAPVLNNSVKQLPVSSLSCANSSTCTIESSGNAVFPCTTNEALQCATWQSQHNNPIVAQVDHEEQAWSPQAVCCCCSFPVLEWRPNSSGGPQFSPCILSSCGGNLPSIPLPSVSRSLPPGVCLNAPESVLLDGGDLPYSDIPTLRFFYNLGHDYLRSGHFPWPNHIPYPVQQRKGCGNEEEGVEGEAEHAITSNVPQNMVPTMAPLANHLTSNIPQSQPYPRHTLHQDQEEKNNFSATPHFGLALPCQPPCNPLADQGRSRSDMVLPVTPPSESVPASEHEMEVPAGPGPERWLELPHHSQSVPYMTMPQHAMPSPVVPYPTPQSTMEGQFYVYAAPPHAQGHHLMYGPIAQPLGHAPHLASATRYMYPAVNSNVPHFALPHQ